MGEYVLDRYKTKIAYSYNLKTGLLELITMVYIDSETSIKMQKDVYLTSPNSTFKRPPAYKDGECVCFDPSSDSWKVVDDNRKKLWWNTETQEPARVSAFDEEPPESWASGPPPSIYHTWNAKTGEYVYTETEKHIADKMIEIRKDMEVQKAKPFIHNERLWLPADLERLNYRGIMALITYSEQSDNPDMDYRLIKIPEINKEIVELESDSFMFLCKEYIERNIEMDRRVDAIELALYDMTRDKDLSPDDKYNNMVEYKIAQPKN